jgi:formylglycine-generating enzyme
MPTPTPLHTFIIYSRHDAKYKDDLLVHLDVLVRKGHVRRWVDSDLLPGEEWEKRIEAELEAANLVLMLVSADALNSEFIQKKELKTALEKKKSGTARIIPILVRDCLWELEDDLAALQMLPKNESGKIWAIESWSSSSAAWASTLRELLKLIQEVQTAVEKENTEKEQAEREKTKAQAEQAAAAEQEKRRQKKDEQTWTRLQKEIAATGSFEEKIDFIGLYINDPDCQNHQEEAQEQLHDLEAERDAHEKIESQKQKAQAERAAKAERQQADENAWQTALRVNTIAAFNGYLDNKDYIFHRNEAVKQIEALSVPTYKNSDTHRDFSYTPEMVYVEGGSFKMGSHITDYEQPIHTVTLSPFWIGKYPVTVEQYEAYCKDTGVRMPDNNTVSLCPVVNVNWKDAVEYTKWLSKKTGKRYRLPTEAEWEFAAKGGNRSKGYIYAGSNNIDEVAWRNSVLHPVGKKKANELGLYDMSGNVWEWCNDWEGTYSAKPQTNPTGPNSGSDRINRGGSAGNDPDDCRIARRAFDTPSAKYIILGFRVVLEPFQ